VLVLHIFHACVSRNYNCPKYTALQSLLHVAMLCL
jgi:hypothetical protein